MSFALFAYILVFVDALGARSFQNIYRLAGIYCENVCKRILLVTRLIQLPVRFCACYMREVLRKERLLSCHLPYIVFLLVVSYNVKTPLCVCKRAFFMSFRADLEISNRIFLLFFSLLFFYLWNILWRFKYVKM